LRNRSAPPATITNESDGQPQQQRNQEYAGGVTGHANWRLRVARLSSWLVSDAKEIAAPCIGPQRPLYFSKRKWTCSAPPEYRDLVTTLIHGPITIEGFGNS